MLPYMAYMDPMGNGNDQQPSGSSGSFQLHISWRLPWAQRTRYGAEQGRDGDSEFLGPILAVVVGRTMTYL